MKQILITGANRGVGLELTRQSVQRGDKVWAGCRSPEKATDLEDLSAIYPGQVTIIPLEITNEESIADCAAQIATEIDRLDIIFNNAAIYSDGENIKSFSANDALEMLNVNAVGQMLVVKHFTKFLVTADEPKLINISSEAGSISTMTSFRGYYYFGSKALLNMFSRALAWDPEISGITVAAIHPGWVRTDMGGPDAHISVTQSAAGIIQVTDALTSQDNGNFYTWDGDEHPW